MRERPFIVHFRNHKSGKIVGNGGATVSFVPVSEHECKVGVAICHDVDMFDGNEGIRRATERAEESEKIFPRPQNVGTYTEMARAMVAYEIMEKYPELIPMDKLAKMKTPAEIKGLV